VTHDNGELELAVTSSDSLNAYNTNAICPLDLFSQARVAHRALSSQLDLHVSQHFSHNYFPLLLLPNCYRGFYDGWLTEIQQLMVTNKSLYYSVLACSASHIFLSGSGREMNQVALSYYSRGVRELSVLLSNTSQCENHDALLMSVMLLYLHGYGGWDMHNDTIQHVKAATRIINLKLLDRPMGIQRLFDRLAVESVLLQQFLLTAGLWSVTAQSDFPFDHQLWDNVEKLLEKSSLLPGAQRDLESPVLGAPISVFHITLILRECYRSGTIINPGIMRKIQREIQSWESELRKQDFILAQSASDTSIVGVTKTRDETCMYAIIASLLLEQVTGLQSEKCMPSPVPRDQWQIGLFLRILKRYARSPEWARSYMGNWPVYTLGLFLSEEEDRRIVEQDLKRSWEVTRMTPAIQYYRDLQKIWG
jgi:hypothetical protein